MNRLINAAFLILTGLFVFTATFVIGWAITEPDPVTSDALSQIRRIAPTTQPLVLPAVVERESNPHPTQLPTSSTALNQEGSLPVAPPTTAGTTQPTITTTTTTTTTTEPPTTLDPERRNDQQHRPPIYEASCRAQGGHIVFTKPPGEWVCNLPPPPPPSVTTTPTTTTEQTTTITHATITAPPPPPPTEPTIPATTWNGP